MVTRDLSVFLVLGHSREISDTLADTFYESLLFDSKLVFLILRTREKLKISVSLINL